VALLLASLQYDQSNIPSPSNVGPNNSSPNNPSPCNLSPSRFPSRPLGSKQAK